MEENAAEDAEKPAIGLESQNTDPAEQPVLKDVNKDTELEVIDDKDLENVPLENNRIEITE